MPRQIVACDDDLALGQVERIVREWRSA